MKIYKAPERSGNIGYAPKIFLAGSVDMGSAVNWQESFEHYFSKYDIIIYNPRRDDWDSTWVQDISNPQFNEQVTWELDHLEESDLIVYYFDPNGKAPITLLELGLYGNCNRSIVCCPEGYWRRGNVQMVCKRFGIPLVDDINNLFNAVEVWLSGRV